MIQIVSYQCQYHVIPKTFTIFYDDDDDEYIFYRLPITSPQQLESPSAPIQSESTRLTPSIL